MYRLLMVFLNYIREYSNDISFTCYYIIMKKLIELLNEYMSNEKELSSSEVIEFIANQSDFHSYSENIICQLPRPKLLL